jgi:MFS family permease
MQLIGQSWLMLDLHGSGLDLGALAAAQFLPVMLFGPYGGLVADRSEKRRLLTITQSLSLVITLTLAILAVTGAIRIWMLFALAAALGLVTAADGPARQVFASDMVPPTLVPNAVSLNEVVVNGARVFGPALGAVLIVSFGTSSAFFFNSASFLPAVIAVRMMRLRDMHSTVVAVAGPGQLREGLRYAVRTPIVRTVVVVASAASGIFSTSASRCPSWRRPCCTQEQQGTGQWWQRSASVRSAEPSWPLATTTRTATGCRRLP